MADGREIRVLNRLVDIHSLANPASNRFDDVGEALGKGQIFRVPSIAALTVYSDGSVPRQAGARNDPNVAEIEVTVDDEPWIPIQVPRSDSLQNLAGNWDASLAEQALTMLGNHIDAMIIDEYLTGVLTWSNADVPPYRVNVEADSVALSDFILVRGRLLRQRGTQLASLILFMDPLAASVVLSFSQAQQLPPRDGEFGSPSVARIFGMTVVETQACRTLRTHTVTVAAAAGGILTLTLSAASGIVVGEPITAPAGSLQANYGPNRAPVLSVNAGGTVITVATAQGDDVDVLGGTNTIFQDSAQNVVGDRRHLHIAMQKIPGVRIVADPDTTGSIMQVSAFLGFIGRAGRFQAMGSPGDNI